MQKKMRDCQTVEILGGWNTVHYILEKNDTLYKVALGD